MIIEKGTKLKAKHSRKGTFLAVANSTFDTEDEWYDIVLDQDYLDGISDFWERGEHVPARKGIVELIVLAKED